VIHRPFFLDKAETANTNEDPIQGLKTTQTKTTLKGKSHVI
jgi:hypothetical protein